ncbi:MAG: PhnD/SsuA/transferrin family substrate-binding protein [Dechloromonas sp.]|uniref:sensor histidine kinase n=1 Tax=Dechloromonas sp. TaxID=1917218 RepID=UPI0027E6B299|nr:PhnD/SsuA/transferrin family substrate-binding protein [Dechloromonas sp.]MBT9519677.1 PhnD/SsuA/transferrin family substrate-binding protein [Dechloromonas sp.]
MGNPAQKFALKLFGLCCCLIASLTHAGEDVRIGVLAWQGLEEAEVHWSSLAHGLEEKLPGKRIVLKHFNLEGMATALSAGALDFVVTNPGHYVTLEAKNGISRIATQVAEASNDPGHVVGSAVIVLDQRQDLQSLDALQGKTLAAVSPDAFGGYQLIWAELRRLGIDPERGGVKPLFTDFPMTRVVEAVRSGRADAGVLRACLLESLERDGVVPAGVLRVLSPRQSASTCRVSSRLFPGWAFAAASGTPAALSRDVLFALLSLKTDADGESWSVPADYHPVHQLFQELQIGPYAFLRETSWNSLLHLYWPWLGGLLLILIAWGGYTLHVEHIVQRRTRELTLALDEGRSLEARVRSGQQQMDHLSRLSILGELSGTLAHELNQPLAAIGNYARSLLLRQDRGQLTPEALRQAAEEIAEESERAAGILGGIRAFAKKRSRVREVCDIVTLVRDTAALMRGILAGAPEVVLNDTLDETARRVDVDPLQIQQVLLNLLKNAWDAQLAIGAAQPIVVSLSLEAGRCAVAVRDHGVGLAQEVRDHLFEAFFTTKPDGLGLGLSICKTIIEAHGGELQAHMAEEGSGMVFKFSLPLARMSPSANEGNT